MNQNRGFGFTASRLKLRRSAPGKLKIGGDLLSGGTEFLLARTGGGFNVPSERPRGVSGKTDDESNGFSCYQAREFAKGPDHPAQSMSLFFAVRKSHTMHMVQIKASKPTAAYIMGTRAASDSTG
jgi:hypothetical protein